MRQDVRKNFEEKVSYIARTLPDMTVTDHRSFLAVDCGLPSDTFNVLVVRDMSAPAELLAAVDRFNAKGFPLAVWCWESAVEEADRSVFLQHKLSYAETHVAMSADLAEIQRGSPVIERLEIRQVMTASDVLQFGALTAALFGESSE